MDRYNFKKARPVWFTDKKEGFNRFAGFYTQINAEAGKKLYIAIAARSYYRLYINGKIAAFGPARTAHHHCRVDEIPFTAEGTVSVAIEVAAYDNPDKYSFDCTLEDGLVIAEVTDCNGEVLSATGDDGWFVKELTLRHNMDAPMGHCRTLYEVYDLDEHSYDWVMGKDDAMKRPVVIDEDVTWLVRRAPFPEYTRITMNPLREVTDWVKCDNPATWEEFSSIRRPEWYALLTPETCLPFEICNETDSPFTGKVSSNRDSVTVNTGEAPTALLYNLSESEVGAIELKVTLEEDGIIDIITSDHKNDEGELLASGYETRFSLKKGRYTLTTFDPRLVKYAKLIVRSEGRVTIDTPVVIDYAYPDNNACYFDCSDGDINRIYEAARRTLKLNTMDIFMDCPDRERGGWLCDSRFISQSAWMMYGDLSVEKDFLENFLKTDGRKLWKGFFPEAYPGNKRDETAVGIENWSFYLMIELYEYYKRSADREFIDENRERVELFMEGLLSLRGESGLVEGMKQTFVDWSVANRDFCRTPISIPINCLAVKTIEAMAELYDNPQWRNAALQMREVIATVGAMDDGGLTGGDAAVFEGGRLRRINCTTEGGLALEIWSGLHWDNARLIKEFVEKMGYCPRYRSSPYIPKPGMFIGGMLRFDILAMLDKIDILINELKNIYLPQLRDGSGTLFESYHQLFGCHGYNAYAGALITEHILGLGSPIQTEKTIRIAPRMAGLRWASGSAKCDDGMFYMSWRADDFNRRLEMTLTIPEGWTPHYDFGTDLNGWEITINGELIR